MSKLHRVLAAVDFSEAARTAFDHALALSRMHDAELLVVHAVPTDRSFNWDGRERIALIGSLRRAAQAEGVRFKVSVQHGDPAGVILLHARARRPDLIVLGTSKRPRLDRFRFGSVAEAVSLEATQPVLVVPKADNAADTVTPFKNVLVAVGFAAGSGDAVDRALSIAGGEGRVTVVHVVRGEPFGGAYRYPYRLMEPEYQRQLARDAWRRIAELVPINAATSRKVHTRVVTGEPAAEISRVAKEVGADLILMGATTRGAIGRLLFGATAARVIRTAQVAVLTTPPVPEKVNGPLSDEKQFAVAA